MRAWLSFALLSVALAGCFDSHGWRPPSADTDAGRDSGPFDPPDAGTCGLAPSTATRLVCPASAVPGETISVDVSHAAVACCRDDGGRLEVRRVGPSVVEIDTRWDRCTCCEACACVGGAATEALAIGSFGPGRVTVRAGALECEIEVAARECRDAPVGEVHAPRAIAPGDALPVLLRSAGSRGCGCVPSATAALGRAGQLWPTIEACGCSDVDPCVDPGYEATAIYEPGIVMGDVRIETPAGTVHVARVDPTFCPASPVLGLRVEAPGRELVSASPGGWWLVIESEAYECCGPPLSVVRETVSGHDRALSFLDCATGFDCLCKDVPPVPFEHWHFLGFLERGRHAVRAGGRVIEFDVP
jgi:hypothetical protein